MESRLEHRLEQARHMKAHQPRLYRWRALFGLVFVLACIACGWFLFRNHAMATQMVDDAGSWGWIAFVVVLSLSVMLLLPTPLIKIFAGAIFPFHIAVLVNFAGSMLGGIGAFVFGRWLFRDALLEAIANDEKLTRIDGALGDESLRLSVLVRLSPIIPDEWLNYILAAGPVSLRTFTFSNCASLVLCLVYAYYGWAIGELALRSSGLEAIRGSPTAVWMLVLGLIATIIATVIVTRVTMKALSGFMEAEGE